MSAIWWADVSTVVAPWLARVTLGGLAVSVSTLLAGSFLRRGQASTRVAVWRGGIVALLLLPIISLVPPVQWTLPVSSEWLGEVRPMRQFIDAFTITGTPAEGSRESLIETPAATESADVKRAGSSAAPISSSEGTGPVLTGWVVLLWALMAGALLVYAGAGTVALRMLGERARDVTAEVADLLPPDRRVRVLRGGPFAVPGCWGMVRPSVLLPVGSRQWSRSRLRAVLLHEAAHLERRDPLFLLLTRMACAVHWMNPFAWQVQRNLLHDGEVVCDADVVGQGVPAHEYAHVLVELAAEARAGRQGLVLTMSRPRGLARRVRDVLEGNGCRPARRDFAAVAYLLLMTTALACATATAGERSAAPNTGSTAQVSRPGGAAQRQVTEHTGTWDARYEGRDEVYVQLVDGAGGGMSANHIPWAELAGLAEASLHVGGEVVFELARPPGMVRFEGRFDAGAGHGTYRFTPREDFVGALRDRGIGNLPPARIILLALQNVDLGFVDDLVQHTAGPINGDLLVRAAIFEVDRGFMQEMAAVGYRLLSVQDLVRLRIFEVDSAYVNRLRDGGDRLTVDGMVSRRIREKTTTGVKE